MLWYALACDENNCSGVMLSHEDATRYMTSGLLYMQPCKHCNSFKTATTRNMQYY
jgi:hypothetical protein